MARPGSQEVVAAQSAMLDADRETLLDHVRAHCPMDPTFAPFVTWAHEEGIEVVVASDGFAFYIEPPLEAAGVPASPMITNEQIWTRRPPRWPALPQRASRVPGCGTCKMNAVIQRRGDPAVAFVGEGSSDRYGALYADVTFAKLDLVAHCERGRRALRALVRLRRRPSMDRERRGRPRARLAGAMSGMDRTLKIHAPDRPTCKDTLRPSMLDDLEATFRLVADAEHYDDGVADVALSDIAADWERPDFDLETMSIAVWHGRSSLPPATSSRDGPRSTSPPRTWPRARIGTASVDVGVAARAAEGRRSGRRVGQAHRRGGTVHRPMATRSATRRGRCASTSTTSRPTPSVPAGSRSATSVPGEDDRRSSR